jgi:hypothetical protein
MKFFSIIVSLVFLIQSFGIGLVDILHVNDLIEHAKFHNQEHGDNLLVFISKHYGDLKSEHQREHKEEREDHEKLPFQHQSYVTSGITVFLDTSGEDTKSLETCNRIEHRTIYQASSSSLHAEGPFEPPRHS